MDVENYLQRRDCPTLIFTHKTVGSRCRHLPTEDGMHADVHLPIKQEVGVGGGWGGVGWGGSKSH